MEEEIKYYLEMVELHNHLPINSALGSAQETTMVSTLGSPLMPLTTEDQPKRVSPLVKQLLQTVQVSQHIVVTGVRPAVTSLKTILEQAFSHEAQNNHNLESVLSTAGMLNVRLRKPTHGGPSKHISNHAWGTAIDFKIIGHSPPADTGQLIPRFIAVLLPFFNQSGWYSGIAFHDSMHFEVSEGSIHQWSLDGHFKPIVL